MDSDTKIAEMYGELRKEGRRDAQHCMPVKQIPDLEWEKENTEQQKIEQNSRNETEKRTGPNLRSSKNKETVNEVKDKLKQSPPKAKKKLAQIFFQLQAL